MLFCYFVSMHSQTASRRGGHSVNRHSDAGGGQLVSLPPHVWRYSGTALGGMLRLLPTIKLLVDTCRTRSSSSHTARTCDAQHASAPTNPHLNPMSRRTALPQPPKCEAAERSSTPGCRRTTTWPSCAAAICSGIGASCQPPQSRAGLGKIDCGRRGGLLAPPRRGGGQPHVLGPIGRQCHSVHSALCLQRGIFASTECALPT